MNGDFARAPQPLLPEEQLRQTVNDFVHPDLPFRKQAVPILGDDLHAPGSEQDTLPFPDIVLHGTSGVLPPDATDEWSIGKPRYNVFAQQRFSYDPGSCVNLDAHSGIDPDAGLQLAAEIILSAVQDFDFPTTEKYTFGVFACYKIFFGDDTYRVYKSTREFNSRTNTKTDSSFTRVGDKEITMLNTYFAYLMAKERIPATPEDVEP